MSNSKEPTYISKISRPYNETIDYLYKTRNYADLKIKLNSKEYNVHRAIVCAALPYFDSMMSSDLKESKENKV